MRQGEDAFNVRISYEANTLITDDTGSIIPTFEGSDERTVFVVGATPATVAAGINLDGELDLLLRHARFDAILSFPAYDPTAFGVSGFQPINPRHSGSWYNIVREGEGVFVEIYEEDSGEEGVFISWYTYRDGVQQWLVGSSPLGEDRTRVEVPLIRTFGASFGDDFRADDVQREAWGTATLAFRSCNRMRFQYAGEDGTGSIEMSRLTILADFDCR